MSYCFFTMSVSRNTTSFYAKSKPLIPKAFHPFCHRPNSHRLKMFPLSGKHALIGKLQKPFIQQGNDSHILHRPNYTSGCLKHLIHAWISIRIIKTALSVLLKKLLENFPFKTHLGQSCTHDNCAYQAVIFQIDSLTENSAQHAKTDKNIILFLNFHINAALKIAIPVSTNFPRKSSLSASLMYSL